jgi:TPR repeat protein
MKGLWRMGLVSAFISLFAGSALSDTAKGIAAYSKGDYPTAVSELEKAAAAGDAQAFFNLGVLHAEGKAGPRDMAKAVGYYRKGADGGSVLAAYNLAQAYRKGDGVTQNYADAARWYEFAAKHGDFRAGNELGLLYVEGKGVKADPVEGFAWIYPSTHATIMDDSAMANAMQLASMMNSDQVQEAQKRGRSYYETYFEPNMDTVEAILKSRGK